jgi:hypothetical protein
MAAACTLCRPYQKGGEGVREKGGISASLPSAAGRAVRSVRVHVCWESECNLVSGHYNYTNILTSAVHSSGVRSRLDNEVAAW